MRRGIDPNYPRRGIDPNYPRRGIDPNYPWETEERQQFQRIRRPPCRSWVQLIFRDNIELLMCVKQWRQGIHMKVLLYYSVRHDVYGKIEVIRSEVMGETLFSSRQYGRQCLPLLPDDVMCRDESKREMAGCVCLMKEDLCATHLISSDTNGAH